MARALQPQLERQLGQPVIVDNRPGAGGVIDIDVVAKATADLPIRAEIAKWAKVVIVTGARENRA